MRNAHDNASRLVLELAEHEQARDEAAFLGADVAMQLAKCRRAPVRPLVQARADAERQWRRSCARLRAARKGDK